MSYEDREYEVGYGKPPTATQFKPGVSGNPSGRPKRKKTLEDLIDDELQRKIVVRDKSGRKRKVTVVAMMIRAQATKALQGDPRAYKLVMEYAREVDEADQEIVVEMNLGPPEIQERVMARLREADERSAKLAADAEVEFQAKQAELARFLAGKK